MQAIGYHLSKAVCFTALIVILLFYWITVMCLERKACTEINKIIEDQDNDMQL